MSHTRRGFLAMTGTALGVGVTGTATAASGTTVRMVTAGGEYYFDPIGLAVEPGTTVTFEIASGSHSATAYHPENSGASTRRIPTGAPAWDSGVLAQQGATWEHTFETTGTHDYYCIPHKSLGMVGRIVVGEPGGPAEGSMPPDGAVPQSETIVEQGAVSYDAFTSANTGGGGDTTRTRLLGAGLFAGVGVLAAIVYLLGNSEGEPFRVGSREWRRNRGLE